MSERVCASYLSQPPSWMFSNIWISSAFTLSVFNFWILSQGYKKKQTSQSKTIQVFFFPVFSSSVFIHVDFILVWGWVTTTSEYFFFKWPPCCHTTFIRNSFFTVIDLRCYLYHTLNSHMFLGKLCCMSRVTKMDKIYMHLGTRIEKKEMKTGKPLVRRWYLITWKREMIEAMQHDA